MTQIDQTQQSHIIPDTMNALVLSGRGFENLAVQEVPVPSPSSKQLLARIDAAGVCTSLLKLIEQGPDHPLVNGWDITRWPLILGDEGALTIVKVGSELQHQYHVGERYGIQPAVDVTPCNNCNRYANNGSSMRKCAVGYTLPGCLAQYMLVQEEVLKGGCLIPLPDRNMPAFAVAMAEPISCVISAQERQVHLYKPDIWSPRQARIGVLHEGVTLILGAGAMGRMHAELALRNKPAILIVSDVLQERLNIVKKQLEEKVAQAGTKLVTATAAEIHETVRALTQGRGVDDMILAVGVQSVQQDALSLLGPGGVANLFGGLPRGKHMLQLDALRVHYDEIRVVGSSGGQPSDLLAALRAIAAHDIDAGNYVAGIGSLRHAPEILSLIKQAKVDGKMILYPHLDIPNIMPQSHWDAAQEKSLPDTYKAD